MSNTLYNAQEDLRFKSQMNLRTTVTGRITGKGCNNTEEVQRKVTDNQLKDIQRQKRNKQIMRAGETRFRGHALDVPVG